MSATRTNVSACDADLRRFVTPRHFRFGFQCCGRSRVFCTDQARMVQCSPGPAGINETDNLSENVNASLTRPSDGLRSDVSKGPCVFRANYPKAFVRSSSDSNIQATVSPLPSTVGDQLTKRGQKCGVEFDKRRKPSEESDTFLNASMQLMQLNGEARQRVRQVWTSVQRLGRENQISEAGMDLLYVELGNILKSMSAEKVEATKHLKSGRLVLLAASPASDTGAIGGGAAVKALFGARPTAQLMQCSLSEDQSKLEMTPIRQVAASTGSSSGSPPNSVTSTLGRFALPSTASLMGMISDAFQEEPTTRTIRLQGCQVRRLVPKSPSAEEDSEMARRAKIFHRFQLLVPYKTPIDGILFPTRAPVPYESFIFEVPTSETGAIDADLEVDDWVWALDRVCRFQLHRLENALREAPTVERYRETLQRHFPVCISLSWLRNCVDPPALQRRASVNLSMIQIVKDLDRDKVLLDGHLFSAGNPFEGGEIESDSVSEVVKYMVNRVLAFEHEATSHNRVPGAPAALSYQPSSPAHRFAKNCEARALAFVERVLQGSSRTQSGGDIYDAISFFCQQEHVSICPVSQDARPVQMRMTSDVTKGIFQVEVQVCMQFKVIELTPRSPTPASTGDEGFYPLESAMDSPRDHLNEWAVLEGSLSRQFTLGQLSAPGTVTIHCVSPTTS
ncbi:hypothetical protein V7S43_002943 [Phytophthora oleae]|uniref:Uncharacterized protein n=1 Tax=Phytophthora oleae TaxID=2107226 RepID=A0ABD3G156_9STRA